MAGDENRLVLSFGIGEGALLPSLISGEMLWDLNGLFDPVSLKGVWLNLPAKRDLDIFQNLIVTLYNSIFQFNLFKC